MPKVCALRRASSKSSAPQHDFACAGLVGAYIFIVTPTTSYPASTKRPAATAESTPPLIAATTRSLRDITAYDSDTGERDAPANRFPVSALGEEFRSAREARSLSLSDVAERLHIRSVYLAAIEDEDWHVIGAPVYVRGFMRTYARFLG